MASKRKFRRRSCERKKAYHSQAEAEYEARFASIRAHGWVHAYKCRFGAHYPIGHPTRGAAQSIIARRRNAQA